MSLKELASCLVNEFGLISIGEYSQIDQNGNYLMFDGLSPLNDSVDIANFSIVVAHNSLNSDNSSLLNELDELRNKLFIFGARYKERIVGDTKTAFISSSLYCAKIELKFKVKMFKE